MTLFLANIPNKKTLYKSAKYIQRYLTQPAFRMREREITADLKTTQQAIAHWSQQGQEHETGDLHFGISSFTMVPFYAKLHGLLAKAMQLEGYKPVVFTNSGLRHSHDYYRLFGIERLIMWNEYVIKAQVSADNPAEVLRELVDRTAGVKAITELKYRGVEVGKHALSMTSRKLVEGKLDLAHERTWSLFVREFETAVRNTIAAEKLLTEIPLNKLMVRDLGYSPHAQLFEVALQREIDCMVHEFGYRKGTWIFKRYLPDQERLHLFSLSDTTWESLKSAPWTKEQDQQLIAELDGRYKADSTSDLRRLNSGKRNMSATEINELYGLDPDKKNAVIFSHLAWDAAFFFGTCLFDDFEAWLFETVRFVAANCPNMNWIVKLHPYNAFKLQRENKTEESEMRLLRSLFPLPDHVKIMRSDTPVSTQSLFPLVDYVLTVNGTVGMEFPCFGIPAVVAGTGRYDRRGFTVDPQSVTEYFDLLKQLHTLPRLNAQAQTLARQHYGHLMLRRQTDLSDVAPMEIKKYHEAQSEVHNNISIAADSLAEFGAAASIQRLRHWLAHSVAEDILEPF